jgi:hypothetical protein
MWAAGAFDDAGGGGVRRKEREMIGHTKVSGPLGVLADGFRAELERLGYTSSREYKLAEVAKRWCR